MPYFHVPNYNGIYYVPNAPLTSIYAPAQALWLPQVSLSIESKMQDVASGTTITQTFVNPSTNINIIEAKYNFPLYESCAIVSFRCYVGRRLIEGIVKEKEHTIITYQEAVKNASPYELRRPGVFSTSIGNVPAGETVKVEIKYIMELKHDAEGDGLRFMIPTNIAPRYCEPLNGLDAHLGVTAHSGITIAVQVTMPSNICSVRSPSHPITVQLGRHVEDVLAEAFNPKHALASLSQSSAELINHFVLIVKCADLTSPRAFLEIHPTIPNSRALMVTLMPKVALPVGVKPEIVFVADRSGSMGCHIPHLKSALGVFLKSLPTGIEFNICSFGTNHLFLWEKSQPYSAETLEQAQRHVDGMSANFGGTMILSPIKSIISRRYKNTPLEIMVLTDGHVCNPEEVFDFIDHVTEDGDVRLSSLGIGRNVSHAHVEGMAKAGRGFVQFVADEMEALTGKVVRMLKGALSAHFYDYELDWEGHLSETSAKRIIASSTNLSGNTADAKAVFPVSLRPDFVIPSIIQAPYKLPPHFPYTRTTAYAILSADVPSPSCIWLRGTTPSGDELELEIAVQMLNEPGQTIHQLAARKILWELEQGTGYLHSGKFGVDRESDADTFGHWVQREGVRVGLDYGIAHKWTSFEVVQRKEMEDKHNRILEDSVVQSDDAVEIIGQSDDAVEIIGQSDDAIEILGRACEEVHLSELSDIQENCSGRRRDVTPVLNQRLGLPSSHRSSDLAGGPLQQPQQVSTQVSTELLEPMFAAQGREIQSASTSGARLSSGMFDGPAPVIRMQMEKSPGPARFETVPVSSPTRPLSLDAMCEVDLPSMSATTVMEMDRTLGTVVDFQSPATSSKSGLTVRQQIMALIGLQTFDGSFGLSFDLAALLELSWTHLKGSSKELASVSARGLTEGQTAHLVATLLVIAAFERKYAADKEVWELIVDKAKAWVTILVQDDDGLRVRAERLVQKAFSMSNHPNFATNPSSQSSLFQQISDESFRGRRGELADVFECTLSRSNHPTLSNNLSIQSSCLQDSPDEDVKEQHGDLAGGHSACFGKDEQQTFSTHVNNAPFGCNTFDSPASKSPIPGNEPIAKSSDDVRSGSIKYTLPQLAAGVDSPPFWHKIVPGSLSGKLYILTVLVHSAIDLAIEGDLLVRVKHAIKNEQLQESTQYSSRKMPVNLSVFALFHLFQFAMAVDAVYACNTLEFLSLTLFNALFLVYAIIQVDEIGHSLLPSAATNGISRIKTLTIIIAIVISIAEVIYIGVGLKILQESGWKAYKSFGAKRMKRMYTNYQVFASIIKFDAFFCVGLSVQFIWLVIQIHDWEYYITCAALPLSLFLLLEGYLAARHENKWMMITFMFGWVFAMMYFIFKLVGVATRRNEEAYRFNFESLLMFAVITVLLLTLTFALALIVMCSFGKGLREIFPSPTPVHRSARTNRYRASIR